MKKEDLKQFVLIFLIASFLIALYGYRLYFPPNKYYDEVYDARVAMEFALEHRYRHSVSIHPPLWHFVSSLFVSLYGGYSWAWRITSALCGVLVVFLVFAVAKTITGNSRVSFLAAFLFTFDGMSFTQARIAMINSMVLMFMLLSLFCFLQFFLDGIWSRPKAFGWAGFFLGLGFASKMLASYMLIGYIIMIIVYLSRSKKDYGPTIRDAFLYLILLPILVYVTIQIAIAFFYHCSWANILSHHRRAYRGFVLTKGHTYASQWWTWPVMKRPIWYFYKHNRVQGIVRGIVCMGNQAVFWMIPLSIGYIIFLFIKKRSRISGLILLFFFGLWLPWAMIRRIKFFHFFYFVMPFACMAIAVLLSRIWRLKKVGKIIVIVYLLLVLGLFVYWYPLLTGFPISFKYFKQHMWFRSWI